ncbi:decarboxylase [Chromatiales bacterium (ex Bugula neritina AB1)]|nr:decarboxylase [Chromatiales bacterium (ex Bugula neritina AB1)]
MSSTHTFEILAECFRNEGAGVCFALLGDANMNWASALADRGCEFFYVRDEHCAVAAAMAWARSAGDVGVATVTCGPGVTQILTALPAAVRANIPLVIFAGEAPLGKPWYNQKINQRPFIEACGARYDSLHHVASMPLQIRDAFLYARSNNQPVVLGVPFDLQELPWDQEFTAPQRSSKLLPVKSRLYPDQRYLDMAVRMITSAKRIVLIGGRGVIESAASAKCVALADQTGALLATTLPARGVFHDHSFCIGIAGGFASDTARRCLQQADLIIAVGCRLAQHTSDSGKLFDSSAVLHIDTVPRSVSQGRVAAEHHLQCDARAGIDAILAHLPACPVSQSGAGEWRSDVLADEIKNAPADAARFDIEDGLHDPRDVVSALDSAVPKDWFTVNSSGHCSWFTAQMKGRPADRFLTIREFGAIGNGIAFAMGVAAANREQTVVLFDGDGSLLMHIQELETIRRHNLNIIICVFNDGAYGSEIHKLRVEGLREDGTVFGRPDFAQIALGFGISGTCVDKLEDLDSLVALYKTRRGAAIWDFHVSDKVVSPVIRRSHHIK